MKIKINGEYKQVSDGSNIIALLESLNIKDITKIVVEHNGDIIEYMQYETTILKENDNVEIVSFVGGG